MDSSPPAHVMATALSAKDIVFSYGAGSLRVEVPAFSPAPGVHHLVGLNGSGKSTFLKVLTGVLRPAEGQVLFHGAAITSADVFRRYCRGSGYLWQNFQLQGRTSTRRYLEYRAWLHGVDPTEARHVAQRALEAVDLLAAARTPGCESSASRWSTSACRVCLARRRRTSTSGSALRAVATSSGRS